MKKLVLFIFIFSLFSFSSLLFSQTSQADLILIQKSTRDLFLYSGNHLLKKYKIALGPHPEGPKAQMGDGKTPEGKYIIDQKNEKSAYHLALHISYPNEEDKKRAKALGVSPGGLIMIHGLPNNLGWLGKLHQYRDWTQGCIGLTNPEIEEVWNLVPVGTVVEIKP